MAVDAISLQQRDREVEREVFREISRERDADASVPPLTVRDAAGTRWCVTEVRGQHVPGARGNACLVFESEGAIRRVWDYPPSWRELPPADLIQVSWGR